MHYVTEVSITVDEDSASSVLNCDGVKTLWPMVCFDGNVCNGNAYMSHCAPHCYRVSHSQNYQNRKVTTTSLKY